jgi:hypothetical protein
MKSIETSYLVEKSLLYHVTVFPHSQVVIDFQQLLNIVEGLSDSEQIKIFQKLLEKYSEKNVVGDNYKIINNSFVLQLNGNAWEMSEELSKFPSERISELVDVIALWIVKNP